MDVARFYFSDEKLIYSDKLARFVCECNKASTGAVLKRLEQRFDCIYIDEVQDMTGYDSDLIELILRSKVKLTLVGDHRQATFRTNNAAKNSAYAGVRIIDKFREWQKANLGTLSYEKDTYRCHQVIADFADAFFPHEPRTTSRNGIITGHDGVFAIESGSLHEYMHRYRPQVLRLDKRTFCGGYEAMNFGESKGLTFDRVLVFPHKKGSQWLSSGDLKHVSDSATKMYVGITRARHSVAFVFDGEARVAGVQ
jgi:ATP-dependent DNA helicase UvrD/PcrA